MPGETCPLCREKRATFTELSHKDATNIDCNACGRFELDGILAAMGVLDGDAVVASKKYLLRALVRTSSARVILDQELISKLKEGKIRDKTVDEKIDLAMQWVRKQSSSIGTKVPIERDSSAFLEAWCKDSTEWVGLIDLIVHGLKTLSYESEGLRPHGLIFVSISYEGWRWLNERPLASRAKGFIAMSFHPSLEIVSDALYDAIRQAGYEPYRVKEDQFHGGVMDRIVANIRESRFVVSDLTQNRGGVYYEAGFAAGLGTPVFMLSDEKQLDPGSADRVHFDVAHLNILTWKLDDLPSLVVRLRDRILAVLGRGPFSEG